VFNQLPVFRFEFVVSSFRKSSLFLFQPFGHHTFQLKRMKTEKRAKRVSSVCTHTRGNALRRACFCFVLKTKAL
jgi:hypothetical protein